MEWIAGFLHLELLHIAMETVCIKSQGGEKVAKRGIEAGGKSKQKMQ